MTVTLNSYDRQVTAGTFGAVEALTQSTATARQSISVHVQITTLGGGTATGFGVNLFTLPGATSSAPPVEGMEKWIKMLATGEAKVVIESIATGPVAGIPELGTGTATQLGIYTSASATGAFVLNTAADFIFAKFFDTKWYVIGGNATYATAT